MRNASVINITMILLPEIIVGEVEVLALGELDFALLINRHECSAAIGPNIGHYKINRQCNKVLLTFLLERSIVPSPNATISILPEKLPEAMHYSCFKVTDILSPVFRVAVCKRKDSFPMKLIGMEVAFVNLTILPFQLSFALTYPLASL